MKPNGVVATFLSSTPMEQNPSWQAYSSLASQESPYVLRNPEVHHRIHKSLPPAPFVSLISPRPILVL
jgi:hypothetical protein